MDGIAMLRPVNLFFKSGLAALALALGACSVNTEPVAGHVERKLRARAVSAERLGFHVLPGGEKFRLQLFRADFPVQPVEVPMVGVPSGLPAVAVNLNGRSTVPLIADTGAQLSVVEAGLALDTKADVFAPANGTIRVAGIGGEEPAWLARFDTATIGPFQFRQFVTVLRRVTSMLHFGGLHVSGFDVNLLGAPALTAFSFVTFDYHAKRIMFSGGTPFVPSRGAMCVPMQMRDGLPHVKVKIEGRSYDALVDTGARDQIFINTDILAELSLTDEAIAGGRFRAAGLGGMIRGRTFKLRKIQIGGITVPDVKVDSSAGPWKVRIGSDLLQRWRTTFDFQHGALWLEDRTP